MHPGKKRSYSVFIPDGPKQKKTSAGTGGEFLAACAQRGRDKPQRYSAAFGMVRSVKSLLKKFFFP